MPSMRKFQERLQIPLMKIPMAAQSTAIPVTAAPESAFHLATSTERCSPLTLLISTSVAQGVHWCLAHERELTIGIACSSDNGQCVGGIIGMDFTNGATGGKVGIVGGE
jgi:hypothetical protein